MENKLSQGEIDLLNYAVKHGFLTEDQADEMLDNPAAARAYIEESDKAENGNGTHEVTFQ